MTARVTPRMKRRAAQIVAGAAFALAAVGALHAPFARPLLMRLGGCPVAGHRMTVAQMENARRMSSSVLRGDGPAPARPAVGFVLDVTTLADVKAWSARSGVDCEAPHDGFLLCKHVQPAALGLDPAAPPVDELSLGFDGASRLVNESTLRTHLPPEVASREAKQIVRALTDCLGPSAKTAGDFDPTQIARPGVDGVSTVAFRFRDYIADVSAMSLAASGTLVREHYMSARD